MHDCLQMLPQSTCKDEGEGLGTDLAIGHQLPCVLPPSCHQLVQQALILGLLLCILLLPYHRNTHIDI